MSTLDFRVHGQRIIFDPRRTKLVIGSKGFLECRFSFSSDWDGMSKVAAFVGDDGIEHATQIIGCSCMVPDEVTDCESFTIQVVGCGDGTFVRSEKRKIHQEDA